MFKINKYQHKLVRMNLIFKIDCINNSCFSQLHMCYLQYQKYNYAGA